jgi:transposase
MVTETVGVYMMHPQRSKEAFAALIQDWAGIWGSAGYGVYQQWVATRHTCLAHLLRSARGLAGRHDPALQPVDDGSKRNANAWVRGPRRLPQAASG